MVFSWDFYQFYIVSKIKLTLEHNELFPVSLRTIRYFLLVATTQSTSVQAVKLCTENYKVGISY